MPLLNENVHILNYFCYIKININLSFPWKSRLIYFSFIHIPILIIFLSFATISPLLNIKVGLSKNPGHCHPQSALTTISISWTLTNRSFISHRSFSRRLLTPLKWLKPNSLLHMLPLLKHQQKSVYWLPWWIFVIRQDLLCQEKSHPMANGYFNIFQLKDFLVGLAQFYYFLITSNTPHRTF
jgi:hypothetical protein